MPASLTTAVVTPIAEHGNVRVIGAQNRAVQNVTTPDNSGEQDVLQINTRGKSRLVVEVAAAASPANALALFKVYGRVYGKDGTPGSWMQLLGNAAGDYTTPIGPLRYSFGANNAAVSPITLAAGAKVVLVLDCQGFDEFKFTANSAGASGTALTLNAQAS